MTVRMISRIERGQATYEVWVDEALVWSRKISLAEDKRGRLRREAAREQERIAAREGKAS